MSVLRHRFVGTNTFLSSSIYTGTILLKRDNFYLLDQDIHI